jgi:hypothetical protein
MRISPICEKCLYDEIHCEGSFSNLISSLFLKVFSFKKIITTYFLQYVHMPSVIEHFHALFLHYSRKFSKNYNYDTPPLLTCIQPSPSSISPRRGGKDPTQERIQGSHQERIKRSHPGEDGGILPGEEGEIPPRRGDRDPALERTQKSHPG